MYFDAPWGLSLKLITAFAVILLIAVAAIGLSEFTPNDLVERAAMVVLPLAILVGAAFFTIRGYEISQGKLLIQRLGWKTAIALDGLETVEVNPEAMKRSIRTFGNGGLFSFSGKFRNKVLGSYRAFATNPAQAVVLKFRDKVVVVTPDNPGVFAERVKSV